MKAKAKAKATTAATSQLDLFSLPAKASAAPVAVVVQRPGHVRRIEEPTHPSSTKRDPLIDFVFGKSRGRGRPEKRLNDAGGADDVWPEDLVDVREAARRLGLSKSTLDKMRCSGRGPLFIRATDRSIRYDPKDLRTFLQERRRRTTSDLAGLLAE